MKNGSSRTTINSHKNGPAPRPLEMESFLNKRDEDSGRIPAQSPQIRRPNLCLQICTLIRLYLEVYPKVFGTLLVVVFSFGIVFLLDHARSPLSRNSLQGDYTTLDQHYIFKAAQLDHWCLFGKDDNDCICDDFNEPLAKEESQAWMNQHHFNQQQVRPSSSSSSSYDNSYDIVIIGDELAEMWHGTKLGHGMGQDGERLKKFWKAHFGGTSPEEEGMVTTADFSGLALGIAEDTTPNLLWRMHHGEIPDTLEAKVWWIMIGGNDLHYGGCSEDATVLGMLRVAEEISNNHPDSVVVLQGILPQTSRSDGSLDPHKPRTSFFRGPTSEKERAHEALKEASLWPSIQNINQQLASFCENHEHIVYFDVDPVFVTSKGNAKYIRQELMMPDYRTPSFAGMKELGTFIYEELHRIIWDDDEENDIEDGSERPPIV